MQDQTFQKRQVAYKIDIATILNSIFQKDELSAGYIQIGSEKISRVNLLGTIVHIAEGNSSYATIDDSTSRISLRTFENTGIFSKFEVGDLVLVVGRIREYNNEKYIIPEIVRKLDNYDWISLRKLEIEKSGFSNSVQLSENKKDAVEKSGHSPSEIIFALIRELDKGDGAPIEEIIEKSGNEKAESIISRLLENGDIFEVKPGKLKVLE